MATTKTNCRTDAGVAVGLINTIINSARILRKMDNDGNGMFLKSHNAIQEALKDLYQDGDVTHLLVQGMAASGIKIKV